MICQHKADGAMIPIKFRMADDDGLMQEYKVKSYRDLSHKGPFEMPNGIIATATMFPFECKIDCFGKEKTVFLYYSSFDHVWTIATNKR